MFRRRLILNNQLLVQRFLSYTLSLFPNSYVSVYIGDATVWKFESRKFESRFGIRVFSNRNCDFGFGFPKK